MADLVPEPECCAECGRSALDVELHQADDGRWLCDPHNAAAGDGMYGMRIIDAPGEPPSKPAKRPPEFAPRELDPANVRPVTWAWAQRIPIGNISLLVGEEGTGKGVVLSWLIARLTRGDLAGDFHGKPIDVLIVGDEDSVDDVWTPRLLAADADLTHVRDLPASDLLGLLDVRRDVQRLREIVREGGFRVVVFDALLDNLPATTDEFKPRSVRAALRPLGRLAREERFAALGSLHTNKTGDTFRQKMSGSHAFNALARSGLLLAAHPSDADRRVLARGKGNLSKRPPTVDFEIASTLVEANGYQLDVPRAVDFGESDVTVEQLLMPEREGSSAVEEAADFLRDELADGAVGVKAVRKAADDAGIAWRTIERAKPEVGVKAIKAPTGWQWELKAASKTAMCRDGGLGGLGGLDELADHAEQLASKHTDIHDQEDPCPTTR